MQDGADRGYGEAATSPAGHALALVQGKSKTLTLCSAMQHLNMGSGKTAAQCAHAALGLYKVICKERSPWLRAWEVSLSLSDSIPGCHTASHAKSQTF